MVNAETSRKVSLFLPVPPASLWKSSSWLCHVQSGVSRAVNSSAVLQWWRNLWKLNQDVREASVWPWMGDGIMVWEMGGTQPSGIGWFSWRGPWMGADIYHQISWCFCEHVNQNSAQNCRFCSSYWYFSLDILVELGLGLGIRIS